MSFNCLFLQACYRQPIHRVPVWYMRQAGRYDPEYRKIKEKYALLEICSQPELAAQVTCMPVHKLQVDAAILYSDIMNPLASMGIDFDIVPNIGPVVHQPLRSREAISHLRPIDVQQDLSHVMQTIRLCVAQLQVPLIGFAGAPFTLASYLIEGKPSRHYRLTKQMMYQSPDLWFDLMDKLGDMVITYLRAQVAAGAHAVQCFDSWAGSLSPQDFKMYVLPTIQKIFDEISDLSVPTIYFPGVSSSELLPLLTHIRAHVIGIDWRVSIREARMRLGERFAIQGNLDPYLLTAPRDILLKQAQALIDQGIEQPGYIFNMGHGLFPEASLDQLKELTTFVHTYSQRALSQQLTNEPMKE